MFAHCFVGFKTRGNNAVWKDEHERTETAVSVFSFQKKIKKCLKKFKIEIG